MVLDTAEREKKERWLPHLVVMLRVNKTGTVRQ
jgi:hypothetical protein